MGGYPAYPKYNDSAVSWLGALPANWEAVKGKYLFTICAGYAPDSLDFSDEELDYFKVDDLNRDSGNMFLEGASTAVAMQPNLVIPKAPFIVFPKRGAAIATNKVRIVQTEAIFDTNLMAVKTNAKIQIKYLAYSLLARGLWDMADISTVPQINNKHINPMIFPLPSILEQQAITRFLDYKTTQLDALIAKREALLDKLAEKRTALITQAVTKGLDAHAPMKDSRVPWLGEIPVGWEVKRIKHLGRIRYGLGEPPEKQEDGVAFIRATDIYRGSIDGSKVQRVDPDKVPWSRNPQLKAKDVLVVRSGAYTGDSAIVPEEWAGSIAGYDMVLTVTDAIPEYLAYNLLSKHVLNGQIYLAKSRAAQPHLNAEELGNTLVGVPPIYEQEQIVNYLKSQLDSDNLAISKIQQAIDALKEYRTALITSAVTGKIDVRNVPLPKHPAAEVAHA